MTKLSRLLLCVVLAGLTTAWAIAQDSDTDAKSKGEVRSITGCVTKGPSANEFLLTASDGSTWEVHNNNAIDLTSHLGHTIEAKGVVSHSKMHNMKEDAKGAAKDSGMKNNNTEHGHLKVTDVRMVSESCQQQGFDALRVRNGRHVQYRPLPSVWDTTTLRVGDVKGILPDNSMNFLIAAPLVGRIDYFYPRDRRHLYIGV